MFKNHFENLFKLNDYFNKKINSSVLFRVNGNDGGDWVVIINEDFQEVGIFKNQKIDIQYEINSKWIHIA